MQASSQSRSGSYPTDAPLCGRIIQSNLLNCPVTEHSLLSEKGAVPVQHPTYSELQVVEPRADVRALPATPSSTALAAMVLAKLGRGWDGEGLSDVLLSAHSQLHVTEHVNYGHFILQMYMAPRGLSLSA